MFPALLLPPGFLQQEEFPCVPAPGGWLEEDLGDERASITKGRRVLEQ